MLTLGLPGKPLTQQMLAETVGEEKAHQTLCIEELKSIRHALNQDKTLGVHVGSDGVVSIQRLCDHCGEPRGEMWIVDPKVWNRVMPVKQRKDDICLDCWGKAQKAHRQRHKRGGSVR